MENLFDTDLFDFALLSKYFSNQLVSNTKWYSFLIFNDVSSLCDQKY